MNLLATAPSPSVSSASLAGSARPPRILIVKLTSLGDVIKALPVVDDIHRAIPGARIDWVVERPVDSLLALHPGIERVIPLELRRFRKEGRYFAGLRAIGHDLGNLRARRYDLIVDLQGRMKSALTALCARGPVTGPAPIANSEPHYQRMYRRCIPADVGTGLNAIARNRALCAAALGYPLPSTAPAFGLHAGARQDTAARPGMPYAVLAHGSSRADKAWPEEHWAELGREIDRRGLKCLLPWGDAVEAQRARRIAARIGDAIVFERRVALREWATVMAGARVVVGADSGLVHLAAACGAPTAAIFVATRPSVFGIVAETPYRNLGAPDRQVGPAEVIAAIDSMLAGIAAPPVPEAERSVVPDSIVADSMVPGSLIRDSVARDSVASGSIVPA